MIEAIGKTVIAKYCEPIKENKILLINTVKENIFEVISVGLEVNSIEVGDIIYAKYVRDKMTIDNEEYVILSSDEIYAKKSK